MTADDELLENLDRVSWTPSSMHATKAPKIEREIAVLVRKALKNGGEISIGTVRSVVMSVGGVSTKRAKKRHMADVAEYGPFTPGARWKLDRTTLVRRIRNAADDGPDEDPPAEPDGGETEVETVTELVERVDQLAERVDELETQLAEEP